MSNRTIIFDNGPLSDLLDERERDREAIIRGLRVIGVPRVTTMNVIESINIARPELRRAKLDLLSELTGDVWPMQAPNELLAAISRAYTNGSERVDLGDQGAWTAIKQPDVVTEEMNRESWRWHADREDGFDEMYAGLREELRDGVFTQFPDSRPRSAAALIRYFIGKREDYYDTFLITVFERQTGTKPSHAEFSRFLDRVPAWSIFWIARLYSMYRRSVQLQRYGKRSNAGLHDLDSSIYLPFCDLFITGDDAQRRALRVLNSFNPRRARVVSYRWLRSGFLIG